MTPELTNDLKLLKMRNALDPSQHYKGSDWKKLPRYFQVNSELPCLFICMMVTDFSSITFIQKNFVSGRDHID